MEIFAKLGVDGKLLLWQAINFIVLMVVLKKLLYSKMLVFLDERSDKIEKSLKEAKEIEENLKKTRAMQLEVLEKARKEAADILQQSREIAEQERGVLIEKTKTDISQLVQQAKDGIKAERVQMLQDAKERFAEVVLRVARVVVADVADKPLDEALVKKAIDKI